MELQGDGSVTVFRIARQTELEEAACQNLKWVNKSEHFPKRGKTRKFRIRNHGNRFHDACNLLEKLWEHLG